MSNANGIRELAADEVDRVGGGEITIVADKDYFGIEVSVGKFSVGVWFTQGSVCGKFGNHSGCVPG